MGTFVLEHLKINETNRINKKLRNRIVFFDKKKEIYISCWNIFAKKKRKKKDNVKTFSMDCCYQCSLGIFKLI